jgi:outer membrane protein assembly factor BamB
MLGAIEGCTNPESAELLPDGESFIFGNCRLAMGFEWFRAREGLVYLKGQAFISRGRISADGTVSLEERHLLTGLSSTLGSDVVRRGTDRIPAGSAMIVTDGKPATVDGSGPADMQPRILCFDPLTGCEIASIPLWEGSAIAQRFNGLEQPNGLAADSDGNIYVTDIPNTNPDPDGTAPPPVPPAVYRIPHASIDGLIDGVSAAADGVLRVPMPGYVNGVTTSPLDGVAYAVSCSPVADPVHGGIYRLDLASFETGVQPPPLHAGLGPLDGVGVTRRGTLLAGNPLTGEIHAFCADGRHLQVVSTGRPIGMPADFNVAYPRALDGEPALLVPDIAVGSEPAAGAVVVLDLSGL